jgi:hypothetical protein
MNSLLVIDGQAQDPDSRKNVFRCTDQRASFASIPRSFFATSHLCKGHSYRSKRPSNTLPSTAIEHLSIKEKINWARDVKQEDSEPMY